MQNVEIDFLVGKTCSSVRVAFGVEGDNNVIFFNTPEGTLSMRHFQDCCETVVIKQIDGDLNDLIDTPILSAYRETKGKGGVEEYGEYADLWTFYRFQTAKGPVTISWHGTSNGYYTVEVSTTWNPSTLNP